MGMGMVINHPKCFVIKQNPVSVMLKPGFVFVHPHWGHWHYVMPGLSTFYPVDLRIRFAVFNNVI